MGGGGGGGGGGEREGVCQTNFSQIAINCINSFARDWSLLQYADNNSKQLIQNLFISG